MTTPAQQPGGLYGRRPPKRAPAIRFAAIRRAGPVIAPPVDYLAEMGGGWLMLGNGPDDTVAPGFGGCGDCVSPETRILTADLRWVPAGELLPGDRLTAFDEYGQGGRGRSYRSSVVEQADRETRPCYDLEFSDGTRVRCSAGHRWLTGPAADTRTGLGKGKAARWVETRHLKLGPEHASNVVKPLEVWGSDFSREAGYLAAAFDGEGHLEQQAGSQRVSFSQVGNSMLAETERCLKSLDFGYQHGMQLRGGNSCADGSARQDIHRITVGQRSQFLRLLGSVRPVRLLEKFQPDKIGRLTGETVRLVRKEFVGEQEIIVLNTSSLTYIAEGLASHNCVAVWWANTRRVISTMLGAGAVPPVPAAYPPWPQVLAVYRTQNPHFDPAGDPAATGPGSAEDGGMDIQTLLEWLVKNPGPDGSRLVGFAQVDHASPAEVDAAVAAGGVLCVGLNVQAAQQAQFGQGEPWAPVPGSPVEGGHCVIMGGYGASAAGSPAAMSGLYKDETWAQESSLTAPFMAELVEEIWFCVWEEQLGAREFQAGVSAAAFAAEFTSITGRPFPVPVAVPPVTPPAPPVPPVTPPVTPPAPPPVTPPAPPVQPPGPEPVTADAADRALADAIPEGWPADRHTGRNEQVAQAVREWLAAKRLA